MKTLLEKHTTISNEGLGKYLVIQTYFERVHLKFLSSLPVGGLGLDLVHDNGYNLKQIEDGDFDRSLSLNKRRNASNSSNFSVAKLNPSAIDSDRKSVV